jgi:hypothetical protein
LDASSTQVAEKPIGELFGRLGEDGRAFVRAEIGLVKAIARHRIGAARNGVIALVAGILLLNAALITLIVSIALALAPLVGSLLAGLITFAGTALVAALLAWWGAGRMSALGGDAEEQAALAAAERGR